MPESNLKIILNALMKAKQIKAAELARQVNLPQPTIHRIVTGATPTPHLSSMKPLANYFNITIDQLRGFEPIPGMNINLAQAAADEPYHHVPLLTWEQVINWQADLNTPTDQNHQTVMTDHPNGANAFALIMDDASMSPQVPQNSTIIIDPNKTPKDRSLILFHMANHSRAMLRQLVINGNDRLLRAASPELLHSGLYKMKENDKYLGMVVQLKYDF